MRTLFLAIVAVLTLGGISIAEAQDTDPAHDIIAVILSGEKVDAKLFSAGFLAAVPIAQLNQIVTQTLGVTGAPESIERTAPGVYVVHSKTHDMTVQISLDAAGQIAGLFFQPPMETGRSIEEILKSMEALGPKVAYLVMRDGAPLYAMNAEMPLAVGSAFKLGVLAVLNAEIVAGKRHWEDIARLEPRQVSLPSGMLHTFPIGSPLTLHTLASLMISISDNTATDVLLDLVGRPAVAEMLGVDFVMKTRELFLLKSNAELRQRYLAADAAGKMALAAEMDGMTPTLSGAGSIDPLTDGAEWYVPLSKLCSVMDKVAALDVMHISPGVARPADWNGVAYKGGSEVGVLNLTTEVVGKDGQIYCVAFTWNDGAALDESKAFSLYSSLLSAMARDKP